MELQVQRATRTILGGLGMQTLITAVLPRLTRQRSTGSELRVTCKGSSPESDYNDSLALTSYFDCDHS